MEWSEEEVNALTETWANTPPEWTTEQDVLAIATRAVELAAARGGTMTVERRATVMCALHQYELPSWVGTYADELDEHTAAIFARNAVLESQRDSYSKGYQEVSAELVALRRERDTERLRADQAVEDQETARKAYEADIRGWQEQRDSWRRKVTDAVDALDGIDAGGLAADDLAGRVQRLKSLLQRAEERAAVLRAHRDELSASNARLLAASTAFTRELDARGGPVPGECSNPDPTAGPTCAERGCEGQTCRYPKTRAACTCHMLQRDTQWHDTDCPARKS